MQKIEKNLFKTFFYISLFIYGVTLILKLIELPENTLEAVSIDQQQLTGVIILGAIFSMVSLIVIILLEYIILKYLYKKIFQEEALILFKRIFFVDYSIKLIVLTVSNLILIVGKYQISSWAVTLFLIIVIGLTNFKLFSRISSVSLKSKVILIISFSLIALL
ncbi:hypothetical protein FQS96_15875 [Enterococcus faecalis]|uniref:hypothetical protein n=1 Tax=Enterococcus TaxID=1350 RepID=UPI0019268677|nr:MULTISPECIES: hypothetical protein [Enterococcus]MBO1126914.1 hypothetical protein [Enterococcus faecalis]MDV2932564.1 hypothetical protein [Enterococcus faecalis]